MGQKHKANQTPSSPTKLLVSKHNSLMGNVAGWKPFKTRPENVQNAWRLTRRNSSPGDQPHATGVRRRYASQTIGKSRHTKHARIHNRPSVASKTSGEPPACFVWHFWRLCIANHQGSQGLELVPRIDHCLSVDLRHLHLLESQAESVPA